MESYLAEEALWANGLAARLRLVQANFADDQASSRQAYIAEEMERGLVIGKISLHKPQSRGQPIGPQGFLCKI